MLTDGVNDENFRNIKIISRAYCFSWKTSGNVSPKTQQLLTNNIECHIGWYEFRIQTCNAFINPFIDWQCVLDYQLSIVDFDSIADYYIFLGHFARLRGADLLHLLPRDTKRRGGLGNTVEWRLLLFFDLISFRTDNNFSRNYKKNKWNNAKSREERKKNYREDISEAPFKLNNII